MSMNNFSLVFYIVCNNTFNKLEFVWGFFLTNLAKYFLVL